MHIRVYVKFHFHLHLQSYLSNWHIFMLLIIYAAILTYIISCLRASGPLPRALLTNPNPVHHPRVLPARNGQCRIHARPERTRPLTGSGIDSGAPAERASPAPLPGARGGRNSRLQHARTLPVVSSWESVLQLVVLPHLVNLFQQC